MGFTSWLDRTEKATLFRLFIFFSAICSVMSYVFGSRHISTELLCFVQKQPIIVHDALALNNLASPPSEHSDNEKSGAVGDLILVQRVVFINVGDTIIAEEQIIESITVKSEVGKIVGAVGCCDSQSVIKPHAILTDEEEVVVTWSHMEPGESFYLDVYLSVNESWDGGTILPTISGHISGQGMPRVEVEEYAYTPPMTLMDWFYAGLIGLPLYGGLSYLSIRIIQRWVLSNRKRFDLRELRNWSLASILICLFVIGGITVTFDLLSAYYGWDI